MSRSVFGRTLHDAARGLLWWALGIAGLVAMMAAVYPSVRGNEAMQNLVQDYPEALKAFIAFGGAVDYASPAGYLGSELFSFMVPLVLLVAAIGAGARAIAGEEEAGTLELLLANPVSRTRVVVEKLAAVAAELVLLCVVLWVALVIGGAATSMHIGAGRFAGAAFDAGLLALGFGAIALLVGAATGRRAVAIAVPAGGAVAAYVVNALAALVSALEPVQKLSPFFHYAASDPLRRGLAWWHVLVLAAIVLAAAAAAPLGLSRRDV